MGDCRLGIVAVLLAASCAQPARVPSRGGVLDLRDWNASPIELTCPWAFYWRRFVGAGDQAGRPDAYLPLANWRGAHLDNGEKLPAFGFATYRLVVHLPERLVAEHAALALQLTSATSAQSVLVEDGHGNLLGRFDGGRPGSDEPTTVPLFVDGVITLPAAETLVITMQLSNFVYARGGRARPMVLGRAATIEARRGLARSLVFFFAGVLFFIGLHHIVMFALRRNEKGPLWLGLFCLLMGLRPMIVGHYVEASWKDPRLFTPLLRIEYLTFYVGLPIFARFVRTLFPRHTDRPVPRAIVLVSLPFIALVLFAPPSLFTATLSYMQVICVVGVIWTVSVLVKVTRLDRDVIALLMLLGIGAMGAAIIHDFLLAKAYIAQGIEWSQYGVVALLMFQSALLAVMNDRARRRVEVNAREIDSLNATLRRQIVDRSTQLQQALMLMGRERGAPELRSGQRLAAYRIERRLGSGGMGVVYQAVRESDGRRVALKVIRGGVQPSSLARFAREAKVIAGLSHPNIVAILDVGVEEGEFFLAMELITGGSLDGRRSSFGRTEWALPLLRQLADALATIHRGGIVHRDLKPANLLIDGESLKVADFGIASVRTLPSVRSQAQASLDETKEADPALTQAGMILGSPPYMAPELAGGAEHASVASDVFSFGVVAFELLSARYPFTRPPVLDRHERRTPSPSRPLADVVPTVDARIASLLDRCLQFDPYARPSSDELLAALDRS